MALMRVGRFIEYVPQPVTLGFTAGIAVVIATLQVKDLFGLPIEAMPEDFAAKIHLLVSTLPGIHWPSLLVAAVTLLILLWPRLKTPLPPQLPAVVIGSLVALGLGLAGQDVETIGSRFSYLLPDGSLGSGIPPYLPAFEWPWRQPGADGEPLGISWQLLRELLPAAFAIAMLGAIESLLCAVVLDGMSGKRHSANSELLGQGIGNLITPFLVVSLPLRHWLARRLTTRPVPNLRSLPWCMPASCCSPWWRWHRCLPTCLWPPWQLCCWWWRGT